MGLAGPKNLMASSLTRTDDGAVKKDMARKPKDLGRIAGKASIAILISSDGQLIVR